MVLGRRVHRGAAGGAGASTSAHRGTVIGRRLLTVFLGQRNSYESWFFVFTKLKLDQVYQ